MQQTAIQCFKFFGFLDYASWRSEFRRLIDDTPSIEVEEVIKHTDQVLHVSFSHDGKRFATSAKDGQIVVL